MHAGFLVEKTEHEIILGDLGLNGRIILKCAYVNRTSVQNRAKKRVTLNMVPSLQVPYNAGIFD
jgi:predicted flavoprotein YhiN